MKKDPVRAARRTQRNVASQEKLGRRAENLVGKRVVARTVGGPVEGVVQEVLTRAQAETTIKRMPGSRDGQLSRNGTYVKVAGVGMPIHRRRIKLIPEGKKGR